MSDPKKDTFHVASMREDGKTDNYFGEKGDTNHGHVVVDDSGNVVYARNEDGEEGLEED